MTVHAPYAFVDARGHEVMVLDETFTVVADIGGEPTVMSATADFELAMALAESLRAEDVAADIEVEQSTLDLTEAVDDYLAEVVALFDRPRPNVGPYTWGWNGGGDVA